MISQITGKVVQVNLHSVIIETASGLGYQVSVTGKVVEDCTHKVGQEVTLQTYLAVRENSMDLYGFTDIAEKEVFELLLGVSGVGPKSALAILDGVPVDTLKEGVASGDASYLTKISGIGKKSAQKIVIELRDKIGALEEAEMLNTSGGSMALDALTSLGYSEREAREALQNIDKSLDTETMIKQALKDLGGN